MVVLGNFSMTERVFTNPRTQTLPVSFSTGASGSMGGSAICSMGQCVCLSTDTLQFDPQPVALDQRFIAQVLTLGCLDQCRLLHFQIPLELLPGVVHHAIGFKAQCSPMRLDRLAHGSRERFSQRTWAATSPASLSSSRSSGPTCDRLPPRRCLITARWDALRPCANSVSRALATEADAGLAAATLSRRPAAIRIVHQGNQQTSSHDAPAVREVMRGISNRQKGRPSPK